MDNRITSLFNIQYPIIQAGMVWCSGWRLASAVSISGGLGIIGAGSMHPEVLEEHILKIKAATKKPFGVNVPLMYPEIEKLMDIILKHKVPVVFTSAGNPKTWTKRLQDNGSLVAHVVSNTKFAIKCQQAGVDVVVAEGFEAGGHNGVEETTTLCLIPQIRAAIDLPLLAAGGISSGASIAACMALGADGVQIGSLFATAEESSAHPDFVKAIIDAKEGDTKLSLKKVGPTRLLNNPFYQEVSLLENQGASPEEIKNLLGKGRAKKGMFEGDLIEGELEIGQVSAMINKRETVSEIMRKLLEQFNATIANMNNYQL